MPGLLEGSSGGIDALLANDSENLGDVPSDLLDGGQFNLGLGRHLGHAELGEFLLLQANNK